ncbi:MAG: 30S ribosomal protein S4 [Bacilli bacterium]
MRYTGPKWKRSRRLQHSLLETGQELAKRNYGPGQHGKSRRRKQSEYGKQLAEKQKLRFTYGVNERQFRRLFHLAQKSSEVTGTAFIQILESRLDNLVYRMGFARTRRGARQLVCHGHVTVNGKKVDLPSYLCSVGDVIALGESSQNLTVVRQALEQPGLTPGFVKVDKEKIVGEFTRLPERSEVAQDINEAQIIEYYNRLL